ncbi:MULTISPECIES: tetratricopeptide repeat protein [Aliiglaciecola]|uniref:tetratricopeptide repeat protein n=1 Tax=Aliiglaciecola TaxID=1406885 RepID=UPI001C09411D|nr:MULTISPECIES: tetratricopeptide repeat protein [Aliiglaciecola]MBU2876978.1 tetratricopeptide repeat protein [Aliiglaciecola lipolytica]MDO6712327.1 tetratricopeptide repeat protein [Aliiglaciecola sp. 2_MG-2023]MDO6753267.1 tetratricopeptide repeat protein [Aliiglaciecola sp. 1_MG-2023]
MSSFIAELRRRNVFNVIAGYAVIGWLVMQLAVVLESALHLPTWFDTIATILVIIGFPIAVLLAWIFQFTPKGLVRTAKNPALSKAANSKNTITIFTLTGVISAGLITLMWMHLGKNTLVDENREITQQTSNANVEVVTSSATQSIAVLPFDDFSASNDQGYFGHGISEELLNLLSRIKGLRVVSRTSSFAFVDTDSTVSEIAKELKVAHILEGSIRKSGNTIRITAQLINAQTDEHIWSETYDRPLSAQNLFAVQDEIASKITQQLKGKLTVVPLKDSDKTLSLEAYELYLQARENQKLRSPESLALAVQKFIKVIDLDPNFAHAYSGLSDTYLLMEAYAGLDKQASRDKASPLVARALELAPNSAEVLASAAYLAKDKNTAASIKQAQQYATQAIEANHNYANAYFLLGGILWEQGKLDEAIEQYKKARLLDPLSNNILSNLARIYLSVDDRVNSKIIGDDLVRLHPTQPFGYSVLADLAFKSGNYSQAHSMLQNAYTLNQQSTSINRNLARLYNLVGLYQHALWYNASPTSQVWHGIYTDNLGLAAEQLAKVTDMTDIAWFLYYLRDYEKTNQIVNAYIEAYKLLDRPIESAASADFIIALAQTRQALGENNEQLLSMLKEYLTNKPTQQVSNLNEIKQRILFATLTGNHQQSYKWLERMRSLGYIMTFIDPIFDEIKSIAEFQNQQQDMRELRDKYQSQIKAQLRTPNPLWIVPPSDI